MGKNEAALISWEAIQQAIQANPHKHVSLQTCSASSSVSLLPSQETIVPWLTKKGWTEDTSFTVSDPISLSLWIREPLYRTATHAIRRVMEMEEAAFLLHASPTAWKEKHGKQRGWIRKHLEEELRARASGNDPAPDVWDAVRTHKKVGHLVDYICVMRSLRIGLWWPEQKIVTMFPLSGVSFDTPIVQLNCLSGHIMVGPLATGFRISGSEWIALLSADTGFTWEPPSCSPSSGSLTVSMIQEKLQALQPPVHKKGGKNVLWNLLLFESLIREFSPK
jgi:hypothetical protein